MKKQLLSLLLLASLTIPPMAFAQLNIPSDGSDGVFAPLTNVVIDLSQAVTGPWNTNNTANAGRGVYDSDKWAIVFKFQSVSVPTNVTVTFLNHPYRAPVVWLVQSNVVINGTVSLDADNGDSDASQSNINKQGGPGGFRGGLGLTTKNGLGPSEGYYYTTYGNAQNLPLIGGAGWWTSNGNDYPPLRRAGGGGAILIASRNNIIINGKASATGGDNFFGHTGFGGAIRLIAQDLSGGGIFDVSNGGRLRLEAFTQHFTNPNFADTFPINPGTTPVIWPAQDAPKATIISVNGQSLPAQPLAALNGTTDLTIATNQAVAVLIQTQNFPIQGTVSLRVIPKYSNAFWVNASYVSGSFTQALWSASANFPSAYSTMIVRAAAP